jgi:hypothetical protein
MNSLKDKACIVGVGESAFTRGSGKTELGLMLEASTRAIADAGVMPPPFTWVVQVRWYLCRAPRWRLPQGWRAIF